MLLTFVFMNLWFFYLREAVQNRHTA